MIKNVIVVNDYDYVQGGASLVAIEQANLLYENGYNVVFFCGISNKEKSILNVNIETISTNKYDSLSNPNRIKGMLQGANNKNAYNEMLKLLSRYNPNETVVSIHGYTKALSVSFIKACNIKNIKTILTAHDYFSICPNGGLFNYKKNMICNLQGTSKCKMCNCDSRNFLYKIYRNYRFKKQEKCFKFRDNINYLITISPTNEELLGKFFNNSKIVRIYNPTSIICKEDRVKCENNTYYIYVGRVDREKGINYMCDSFSLSGEELRIVGTGNVFEELKNMYCNNKKISFLGWKTHDEVIALMKNARALIFPPLLYEGAPLTIFEASSLGLPCIVSSYSNAKDFVDENNGWIYNPYDINILKSIIEIDSKEIKEKSINSYNKYWENPYSKDRYFKELDNLLKSIK